MVCLAMAPAEPNNYNDDYDDDGDGNSQDIGNGIPFTNTNEMNSMIKIMVVLYYESSHSLEWSARIK